jgi:plastocyanin
MQGKKTIITGSYLLLGYILLLLSCTSPEPPKFNIPQSKDTNIYPVDTTASSTPATHGPHYFTVNIKQMKFDPELLSVHKGDTVNWKNDDLTNHCITEVNKKWTSGSLTQGAQWQKVITKPFDYYCAIHLVMKGKVEIVQTQ